MQQCRRVTLVMFTWMLMWLCTIFLGLARCEEVCSASGHLRQGHASMQCLCSRCWCVGGLVLPCWSFGRFGLVRDALKSRTLDTGSAIKSQQSTPHFSWVPARAACVHLVHRSYIAVLPLYIQQTR